MSKPHSKYSPSSAVRWLNCPGSIRLIEKLPPAPSSKYADEGIAAHLTLEAFLKKAVKIPGTPEMKTHGQWAFNEIKTLRKNPKDKILSETKVDLSFIAPQTAGTTDALVIEPFGTLHVVDYKYGAGISVDAIENPQLILYGLGAAHQYDYDFKEINLVILQPRAFHELGPKRTWTVPIREVLKWKDKFQKAIDLCESPQAETKAGPWCRFCPAAAICPQISSKALTQAQVDFDPVQEKISFPNPENLSLEKLGEALHAFAHLEFWISEIRKRAFDILSKGGVISGYKLVPKRAMRRWIDETKTIQEAKNKFGEKAFSHNLLSPAQLEKIAEKEWIEKRTHSVSSGLTMVADSDKRAATNYIETDFRDDI